MTSLRKIRLDLATPPEVAIRAALAAVEAMPADVRLTTASMHIQSALDCVATYVDEQMVSAGLDDGTSLAEERNALQAASDECSRQTATDKAEERARIIAWLRDVGVGPSLTASALRKAADDLASEQSPLQAWCNDYEVVAARSEEEARDIVRKLACYEEQDIDGEGWSVLPNEKVLHDEDGKSTTETVGDVLRESTAPRHLWSCEV